MGDKQQYLDQKAKAVLTKYELPNIAAVLVRDNGQTVVHSAQGVRDSSASTSEASNKVTKSDYFNVGSIAKPITGFLLACLIKKNVLSWNTKIADVFTEFRVKAFRDRCGMNENFLDTKVYELMAHTSGIDGTYFHTLNGGPDGKSFNGDTDPYRFMPDHPTFVLGGNSRDKEWQNLQSLVYQRYLYTVLSLKKEKYVFGSPQNLAHQNKQPSGYGSAPVICASMVERLTGKPSETVMSDLLSNPLQLQMIYGLLPNGMQGHTFDMTQNKFVPAPAYNNNNSYVSKFVVGGIHTTVEGMAQYIKYNLRATNQSTVFDVAQYQAPVSNFANGGLALGGGTNHEPLNHSGATYATCAMLYIYPHSGFGYAVMQNCNGGQAGVANSELFGELGKMHQAWNTI